MAAAIYIFIRTIISKQTTNYSKLRIILGRFLIVALEFQLAGDIVGTAVSPSWEDIAQLAAIALIRTFLNYFLNREINIEEIGEKNDENLANGKKKENSMIVAAKKD